MYCCYFIILSLFSGWCLRSFVKCWNCYDVLSRDPFWLDCVGRRLFVWNWCTCLCVVCADKKSVLYGATDDESVPNTYDYTDSFIDDGSVTHSRRRRRRRSPGSRSGSSSGASGDDGVTRLVNEAKQFVRNKKLAQKTWWWGCVTSQRRQL